MTSAATQIAVSSCALTLVAASAAPVPLATYLLTSNAILRLQVSSNGTGLWEVGLAQCYHLK